MRCRVDEYVESLKVCNVSEYGAQTQPQPAEACLSTKAYSVGGRSH